MLVYTQKLLNKCACRHGNHFKSLFVWPNVGYSNIAGTKLRPVAPSCNMPQVHQRHSLSLQCLHVHSGNAIKSWFLMFGYRVQRKQLFFTFENNVTKDNTSLVVKDLKCWSNNHILRVRSAMRNRGATNQQTDSCCINKKVTAGLLQFSISDRLAWETLWTITKLMETISTGSLHRYLHKCID